MGMVAQSRRVAYEQEGCVMAKAIAKDAIKVGVDVGRGIMVHAKGNPAQIVAVAAAAGIAVLATAIGYAAVQGVQSLTGREDD